MRTTVVFFIFSGSVFFAVVNCGFLKQGERFDVELLAASNCEDSPNTLRFYPNLKKFNRTSYGFSVSANLSEDFGKLYSIDSELQIWKDGGWKRNFLHVKRENACASAIFLLGNTFKAMMEAAHIPAKCPIVKGYHEFKDHLVVLNTAPVLVQEGKYRAISKIWKDEELQLCFYFDMNCQRVYGV